MMSAPVRTYYDVKHLALAAGHEIDSAGWRHKLLMWNWHNHAMDGYPAGISNTRSRLRSSSSHKRGKAKLSLGSCANAWDDIAEVDFYQRDWTDDGIPSVGKGGMYWSGWWFATIAERDRFVAWERERRGSP
jgi:hypothetical protein